MYTVLRFVSEENNAQSLETIARLVSAFSPASFDGMDRVPNRFSCSICDSSSFPDHISAICHCVESWKDIFTESQQLEVSCTFDVAFDVTDLERTAHYMSIGLNRSLLSALVRVNVALDLTIYHNLPVTVQQLDDGSFAYFRDGKQV